MRTKSIHTTEGAIPVRITRLKNGEYLASSRVLPELIAQGRTMAETLEIAQDVARKLIESYVEHGDPLPSALRKQLKQSLTETRFFIPIPVGV